MPIESFDNIDDLDPLNPLVDDPVSEGDDHLRGIKNALQQNVTGDAAQTRLLVAALDALVLSSTGAVLTQGRRYQLIHTADALVQYLQQNSIGGVALRVESGNAQARLSQVDAGGVLEASYIRMTRDAGIELFFADDQALATVDRLLNTASAQVKNNEGSLLDVGFNKMPRVDIGSGVTRILDLTHAGKRFRVQGADSILELGDMGDDSACNVYVSQALNTSAIRVPAGKVMRYYGGSGGQQDFTGLQLVQMKGGSAFTIVQFTNATFELWGGELT